MTAPHERFGKVRADETGAAGDEDRAHSILGCDPQTRPAPLRHMSFEIDDLPKAVQSHGNRRNARPGPMAAIHHDGFGTGNSCRSKEHCPEWKMKRTRDVPVVKFAAGSDVDNRGCGAGVDLGDQRGRID
jgi:hypothetical protein